MKFINFESIQENEKKLIGSINAALDWEAIGKKLMEKHHFTLQEKIECENGDLVVWKDTIAYKFDFDIKIPISLTVNRQGECLDITALGQEDEKQDQDDMLQDVDTNTIISPAQENKVSQMASNIADMISEINQGDE